MGLFSSLFGKEKASSTADAPELPEESIPDLAAGLDSPDGALRVDAMRALLDRWRSGEVAAAEVVAPRLPELLDDAEPLVRIAALAGVRLLRKPENVAKCESGVLALLADPVQQVRSAAIWCAVRLPGETARTQVRAALGASEELTRFAAACALSEVNDGAALPELIAALRDEHRRQEALSALMSLGDAAAVAEIAHVFEDESLGDFDRTVAAAALARFGDPRGVDWLVERIASGGDDRPVAAEWAGRLGVQQATAALRELADSEGDPAQGAALRALGRLRAGGAEEKLLALAADPGAADDLRMDAAEGLAELQTPGALELLKKLSSEDSELGKLCAELQLEIQHAD